jgi:hypothetical protein
MGTNRVLLGIGLVLSRYSTVPILACADRVLAMGTDQDKTNQSKVQYIIRYKLK